MINKRKVIRQRIIRLERRRYHDDASRINSKKMKKTSPEVLVVPVIFSISENIRETLSFLKNLEKAILCKRVVLVFKNVCRCDSDALLYLMSVIDRARIINEVVSIGGDLPDDRDCRELIIESGFFDFVRTKPAFWHPHTNDRILTIKTNSKTKAIDASDVVKFVEKHISGISYDFSKSFYTTLIEMMTNTRAHAFKVRNKFSKWYVMAKADAGVVQMVFLDGGVGIPETLHKNWFEKCQSIISKYANINSDTELLRSALNGAFRTQTRERYRGKGMPAINKFSQRQEIKDFLLLSRRGVINYSNKEIVLDDAFTGTLYAWTICKSL